MDKIRVFTLCSGYDSQCLALRDAGVDFELVGWSDIDKYAIAAHDALFPEYSSLNYGDMTKIDWENVPDFDLLTYSTPCTDISQAGHRKGIDRDSGTRSSLLWHTEKAIMVKRPKVLLMENVYTIVGKKYKKNFDEWVSILDGYGYKTVWGLLEASDFGVPQHRQRLFAVSFLSGHDGFTMPVGDKKDAKVIDFLTKTKVGEEYFVKKNSSFQVFPYAENMKPVMSSKDGVRFVDWGGKFLSKQNPDGTFENRSYNRVWKDSNYVGTLNCTKVQEVFTDGRIRKLTEEESLRLMGMKEPDVDKLIRSGIPKSQLYKLAGNSIVVDPMREIFRNVYKS